MEKRKECRRTPGVRTNAGRYQLAYGHNRLAALHKNGETHAEFIVQPLSDYDMLVAMIDENATQRNQTARIVNENIYAGVQLAERLLGETKTVEEFNEVAAAKIDRCPGQDNAQKTRWRYEEYQKAKGCLESGQGLGRGFLKHFMPDGMSYGNETYQVVLDSVYAKSRKAAAEKKAQEAQDKEAERSDRNEKARQRHIQNKAQPPGPDNPGGTEPANTPPVLPVRLASGVQFFPCFPKL